MAQFPQLFLCYINDCIGPASCAELINFTPNFHHTLKFTWITSDKSFPFLYQSVSNTRDRQKTDVYYKPTDSQLS